MSATSTKIARWFGVTQPSAHTPRFRFPRIHLRPGHLILLAGPSGSGKSTLLNRLRKTKPNTITLEYIPLPDRPVIDLFCSQNKPTDTQIIAALELLSRVGLGEVWTYLRTPSQLSDGQRWRLRLALALCKTNRILFADEFAANLDSVTAAVVARTLRKSITAPRIAVVATCRDELIPALAPDQIIHCDFGQFTRHSALRTQH
jgi:ABC-type ATPase with predicted acetyltransferase domain